MRSGQRATFLARCDVDPDKVVAMDGLRAQHLEHVSAHRDRFVFGGVQTDDVGAPATIWMFMDVATSEEAWALIDADPYRAVYGTVAVDPFVQRLPDESFGGVRP